MSEPSADDKVTRRQGDQVAEERVTGPNPSALRKLGIGAAMVALPVAAGDLYFHVKDAGERDNRAREKGATYDAGAMRRIDPSLIKYTELMRIETGFQAARAIAHAQGKVYVAGDRAVRRFSETGAREAEVALEDEPTCLAVRSDGGLVVGFKDHVELYGADGQRAATWKSFGPRSVLTCIAVSGSEIYVADAGQRVVYRCDQEGKVLAELGKGGLVVPSPHLDVAVGADGMIWVANPGQHRVEGYNSDGELQRFWGQWSNGVDGFVGCCNPCDFAILPDGRFVTVEKSLPRVKVHSAYGAFESVVAAPGQFAETMTSLDVATDSSGKVFILEPASKSVRVFVLKDEG